jgi:hypothetical protein
MDGTGRPAVSGGWAGSMETTTSPFGSESEAGKGRGGRGRGGQGRGGKQQHRLPRHPPLERVHRQSRAGLALLPRPRSVRGRFAHSASGKEADAVHSDPELQSRHCFSGCCGYVLRPVSRYVPLKLTLPGKMYTQSKLSS